MIYSEYIVQLKLANGYTILGAEKEVSFIAKTLNLHPQDIISHSRGRG